jgi:ankyrin repeat protein
MALILMQRAKMDGIFVSNARTALHEAVSVSDLQTVHYLLFKNAQVDIKNSTDETPKDLAIRKGLDTSTIDLFFSIPCH